MRKLIVLFTFLVAAQTGATHYDVIYRFDSLSVGSDDYFVMKIDFDALAPEGYVPPYLQEVSSFEEFYDLYFGIEYGLPAFYFEFIITDTNMDLALDQTHSGLTGVTATTQPMSTGIDFAPASFLRTGYLPIDPEFFPTSWGLGTVLGNEVLNYDTGEVTYYAFTLTEITPVPLPAALPLFGGALLLLTRATRRGSPL